MIYLNYTHHLEPILLSYSKANLGRNRKRPDEAAWNNVILPILELQQSHFTKSWRHLGFWGKKNPFFFPKRTFLLNIYSKDV